MLGSKETKRKTRNFKGLLLKDTSASHTEHESPLDQDGRSFLRSMSANDDSIENHAGDNSSTALGSRTSKRMELPEWFSPKLRQPHIKKETLANGTKMGESRSSSVPSSDSSPSPAPTSNSRDQEELSQRMGHAKLEDEGNTSQPLELKNHQLQTICELGAGNGGTVSKVLHVPTGIYMAKKVVFIDAKPEVRKQILRELQILHECQSQYIVGFYGACLSDIHIYMCMEYMDVGSLDAIYSKHGAIDVRVCGKIVVTVVQGLSYLYEVHRIIHRDVKPSNILVNRRGEIKLCDFGVSGELINSIADTFVGEQYSIKSDVWSLGITMVELAHGCFPFALESEDTLHAPERGTDTTAGPENAFSRDAVTARQAPPMSILELLQHIVYEPPPSLNPAMHFPPLMIAFVNLCLTKDPTLRPTPMALRDYEYVRQSEADPLNLADWVAALGFN